MMSARPDTLEGGFRPLQIYEQVAEKIRDEIRAGRYAAESRLPSERELAVLFQVGRPAVREALGALQNEGLVFTKRNSGTYVVASPLDVLAERGDAHRASEPDFSPTSTLDVRLILEPAIARLAAAHGRADPGAERYLAQMETITDVDDPHQRALWNESDRLFHRQLALMTGDALIVKIAVL